MSVAVSSDFWVAHAAPFAKRGFDATCQTIPKGTPRIIWHLCMPVGVWSVAQHECKEQYNKDQHDGIRMFINVHVEYYDTHSVEKKISLKKIKNYASKNIKKINVTT